MSLGADVLAALPLLREQAASRFTETLDFFTSTVTPDPDTLLDVVVETAIHAGVPGRIKYATGTTVSEHSAVGQQFAEQAVIGSVAVGSAPDVRSDHFCRVVASAADSGLVGRVYRVKGSASAGQISAHRFPLEELS